MRTALITGANGGLGLGIARALLTDLPETFVWLGVRERREAAEALAGEFSTRSRCITLDVTKASAWGEAVKEIHAASGQLDVLVNNAGSHQDGLLATMPPEAWQGVIAANLDAVFHGCQAVLPGMISKRFGRIINISSLSALLAPAGQTNYAAAKAGVVALTQSLAKEVARIGITVNAICPGYIETEALKSMSEEQRRGAQAAIPMRRFGKPSDVAAAVKFLAGAEAGYITGACLKIDGGIL